MFIRVSIEVEVDCMPYLVSFKRLRDRYFSSASRVDFVSDRTQFILVNGPRGGGNQSPVPEKR